MTISDEAHHYVSTVIHESRNEPPTPEQAAVAEQILTDMLAAAQQHGLASADLGVTYSLADNIVTFARRRG